MTLFRTFLNIFKNEEGNDAFLEPLQRTIMLNFILFTAASMNLFFALVHFFFFEKYISYVLFSFFILFALLFFLFKKINNYNIFSSITIFVLTALLTLIILTGAGKGTGIIWGLIFPVFTAFTVQYKKYNLFSLIFLFINLIIFFIPNDFDFWAKYSNDIILRYLFSYLLIYIFVGFYLRLKQQTIYKKEKEIIELKHQLLEKDRFISSLSYDIRSPLNNIAGIINHQRDIISENVLEEIEMSVSNLASTLNKISEKTEDPLLQITGHKTPFKISGIIKKLTDLFQTDKYSKLKFNIHISDDMTETVFGDKISFMQLFISSIDFLFNHSNENQLKTDIISQKTNDEKILLKISVRTENLIFPKNINTNGFIENINDLKIINQITESLNGKLRILNENNIFSLLFILDFKPPEKETVKTEKIKDISDSDIEPKKIKLKDANILLVEDDVINSKVMILNIQKYVNKIIVAENGKEALEKFAENKIDIILMDIRMPYMDGFKTTEKIRNAEAGTGSYVPIIAVTANASSDVKKRCFEAGMNDYTTKPTNYKLLLKKMKKLLEG